MGTFVFKNALLQVGAANLSGALSELSLTYEAESLDETAMGSDSRKRKGGLKDWRVEATFLQDFTCVDGTLFGIVGCQTCIEVRSQNVCATCSNPRYQGTIMLQSAPPFGGGVGSLVTARAVFQSAGDLSRSTTSTV